MASASETLLSRFIDAWNAGQRPEVDEYLDQAPEGEREDLAEGLRAFLEQAPTPEYSEQALAQLRTDPRVARLKALPAESGLWPQMLPSLRRRARLRRDQVVASLAEALGVAQSQQKVARYYHGMETGTLDPAGVSRRVIDALASILGASSEELSAAGEFRGFHRPAQQAAFGRAYGAEHEELEDLAVPAQPAHAEWDEVDELFQGGR
jgi:hypothetical protein